MGVKNININENFDKFQKIEKFTGYLFSTILNRPEILALFNILLKKNGKILTQRLL